jgi:arylsulfatase A-like enzyme
VVIVLIDDIGFGHSSAFGGPINMPTLEKLANNGLRYNRFHTTALCSPTRVALLTGHNHHANNAGAIMELATAFPGNTGVRPKEITTLAEILKQNGYSTAAFGNTTRRRLGKFPRRGHLIAGRPVRVLTSSTASSAAKPISGRRRFSMA